MLKISLFWILCGVYGLPRNIHFKEMLVAHSLQPSRPNFKGSSTAFESHSADITQFQCGRQYEDRRACKGSATTLVKFSDTHINAVLKLWGPKGSPMNWCVLDEYFTFCDNFSKHSVSQILFQTIDVCYLTKQLCVSIKRAVVSRPSEAPSFHSDCFRLGACIHRHCHFHGCSQAINYYIGHQYVDYQLGSVAKG